MIIDEDMSYAGVLSRELRSLRMQTGLHQYQVADLLGISRPTANHWERARELPGLTRLVQASLEIYDVDPQALLVRVAAASEPDPRMDELGIPEDHQLLRAALAHHFATHRRGNDG